MVAAGETVVQLDDAIPAAALETAEAEALNRTPILVAEKSQDLAESEYQRAQNANRNNSDIVSGMEVERLRQTEELRRLDIDQAKADFELAGLRRNEAEALLDSYRVVAPFDGVVIKRAINRGEAVRRGDPILEIVNVTTVRIEAEVPVRQTGHLSEGKLVGIVPLDPEAGSSVVSRFDRSSELTVTSIGPEASIPSRAATSATTNERTIDAAKILPGKVIFISPVVEPVSRTVRVHVEVDNTAGMLLPGLYSQLVVYPDDIDLSRLSANPPITESAE